MAKNPKKVDVKAELQRRMRFVDKRIKDLKKLKGHKYQSAQKSANVNKHISYLKDRAEIIRQRIYDIRNDKRITNYKTRSDGEMFSDSYDNPLMALDTLNDDIAQFAKEFLAAVDYVDEIEGSNYAHTDFRQEFDRESDWLSYDDSRVFNDAFHGVERSELNRIGDMEEFDRETASVVARIEVEEAKLEAEEAKIEAEAKRMADAERKEYNRLKAIERKEIEDKLKASERKLVERKKEEMKKKLDDTKKKVTNNINAETGTFLGMFSTANNISAKEFTLTADEIKLINDNLNETKYNNPNSIGKALIKLYNRPKSQISKISSDEKQLKRLTNRVARGLDLTKPDEKKTYKGLIGSKHAYQKSDPQWTDNANRYLGGGDVSNNSSNNSSNSNSSGEAGLSIAGTVGLGVLSNVYMLVGVIVVLCLFILWYVHGIIHTKCNKKEGLNTRSITSDYDSMYIPMRIRESELPDSDSLWWPDNSDVTYNQYNKPVVTGNEELVRDSTGAIEGYVPDYKSKSRFEGYVPDYKSKSRFEGYVPNYKPKSRFA